MTPLVAAFFAGAFLGFIAGGLIFFGIGVMTVEHGDDE